MGERSSTDRERGSELGTWAHLVWGVAVGAVVGADGSLGWRVLRVAVVVVLAVGGALAWRTGRRSAAVPSLAHGFVGLVVGLGIGVRHLTKEGFSLDTVAGLLALVAGAVLVVGGTRRLSAGRGVRRSIAIVAFTVLAAAVFLWLAVPAVLVTNVPEIADTARTPADVGLDYREVEFDTTDGVRVAAWYIPSRNGAAVVLRHGAGSTRSSVLRHAATLAEGGYGVLATDARGHGDSGGRAMDLGWYGDEEIGAAVSFLLDRPDVDAGRVGVVGMSMGGEEAIGAAGSDQRILAVVAEGATARTVADKEWYSLEYGTRGELQLQLEQLQYGLTDLLTAADPPPALRPSVSRSGADFLLIAAGQVPDEQHAAAHLENASPDRVATWVVEGAGHTAGLTIEPEGWKERVLGFLDRALGE